MHTVVLQGLLSVFVGSGSVSAVEPAIIPGIDRTCKNQGGKGKALCGKSDDEDEGDGVHGGVSPFLIRCSRYFSDKLLPPSRRSLRVNRAGLILRGFGSETRNPALGLKRVG